MVFSLRPPPTDEVKMGTCFHAACRQETLLSSVPTGLFIPWACLPAWQQCSTLPFVKGSYRFGLVPGPCYRYRPSHEPGEQKGLPQSNKKLRPNQDRQPIWPQLHPLRSWGCSHPKKGMREPHQTQESVQAAEGSKQISRNPLTTTLCYLDPPPTPAFLLPAARSPLPVGRSAPWRPSSQLQESTQATGLAGDLLLRVPPCLSPHTEGGPRER